MITRRRIKKTSKEKEKIRTRKTTLKKSRSIDDTTTKRSQIARTTRKRKSLNVFIVMNKITKLQNVRKKTV